MLDLIGRAQAAVFDPPSLEPITDAGAFSSPTLLITTLGEILVWLAGVIALAYLIYGGILYITAGGDAEKATKGRTAVINAVIGIIIVLLAIIIINWVRSFLQHGAY